MNEDQIYFRALVRRQTGWRYVRWMQLLGGAINIVVGTFFVYEAHKRASATDVWDGDAVLLYPLGMIMFCMGGVLCAWTILIWQGDPVVALLLKLMRKTGATELETPNNDKKDAH